MSHKQLFELFRRMFPDQVKDTIIYFPNGKNSIRLRGFGDYPFFGQDFVFSYDGKEDWRLETVDSYLKWAMKGDKKR